jgi:ABC-type Mn2+/Zn2+ transport system permease subunit
MTAADVVSFLALPFAAAVLFVMIHAWFGVQVLRRNVIFADLALAQLSALGATVAFALGYPPTGSAGFVYALLLTALGAGLLTLSRGFARHISQEAFVGILYVAATAVTILVVDRAPQGAEHVKSILVGSILTVGPGDIAKFALLFGVIGFAHYLARRPLAVVASEGRGFKPGAVEYVGALSSPSPLVGEGRGGGAGGDSTEVPHLPTPTPDPSPQGGGEKKGGAVSGGATPDTGYDGRSALAVMLWDSFFFLSFGIVVTTSVATAGVLLVFSFLIVPAVIGSLFSRSLCIILPIAWGAGIATSAAGLAGSYVLDVSTGAAMVIAFTLALVLAGLAKALVFTPADQRRRNVRSAVATLAATILVLMLASSLWLMAVPQGDQPVLAAFERVSGLGPERYLGASDRATFESAVRDEVRYAGEIERLNARERAARTGPPLADDEVRRIASYQQSFNEMARGERFVQDVLRAKARARERWIVGIPAALLALVGLMLLAWPHLPRRSNGVGWATRGRGVAG